MERSRGVHEKDAARGRGRWGEDLGDVQASVLAEGAAFDVDSGQAEHERGHGFARGRGRRGRRDEQGAASRELGPARAIGEEAKVSNADEAARDDVEEKATNELLGLEGHHFHAVVVRGVLPAKSYEAVSVTEEAVVGDRHPVRVATEVLEDLGGPAKGRFAYTTQACCRSSWSHAAKAPDSARVAIDPANTSWPAAKARWRASRYLPRKTFASARTGKRKPGGAAIQRAPSWVSAPPVTTQCKCRCWERFWPQVCRIAVPPRSPPSWRGSRAKVVSVAATARKSSV